uniref:cytochrome c n=1 Tax=Paraburkholderia sp. 22B1P TaxID=3080498 RepID=UPI00403F3972
MTGFAFVAAVLVSILILVSLPKGTDASTPVSGAPADIRATVSRGEYLAKAADCVACHTASGEKPYAGGRPFRLPFGVIYSTNVTPDTETGIGGWSDEMFLRAVREGVGPHGNLYPAMPYTSYTAMSREDVLAIKSYLDSLPPVRRETPPSVLRFPFDQRWGMKLWNLAFFRNQRFHEEPLKGESWNRGAYLAGALGHCSECHTPRNAGFALDSRDYLAGTVVDGWKAYNTTSDQSYGIGAWTDEQLIGFLYRGHAPGRGSASGPMAEVVENSLQYLSPKDMRALVVYLRTVSPRGSQGDDRIELHPEAAVSSNAVLPGGAAKDSRDRGRRLFEGDCIGCHQWNGVGRETDYASLVGSHAVNDPDGRALVQVILNGTSLTVDGKTERMPGFGTVYSDADVAAVANFVIGHFGSKSGRVTAESVKSLRSSP